MGVGEQFGNSEKFPHQKGGKMGKQNIVWYEDDELKIEFDGVPHVCMRYVLPSSTPAEVKSIKKYPFINKTTLRVTITDKIIDDVFVFDIAKGYCFDGASIPRLFWRVIGSNTDNSFLIPALIHDVICENHFYIGSDREFSTQIFDALLKVAEVPAFKRFLMTNSVDVYQRFCDW